MLLSLSMVTSPPHTITIDLASHRFSRSKNGLPNSTASPWRSSSTSSGLLAHAIQDKTRSARVTWGLGCCCILSIALSYVSVNLVGIALSACRISLIVVESRMLSICRRASKNL